MPNQTELLRIKNLVAELEALGHRGSATSNERAAAELVQEHLENLDIEVKLQSFNGHTSYGTRILVHLLFGFIALALLFWFPLISICLSLTTFVSFLLETSSFPNGLSSIFSGGKSQNLIGRIPANKQALRRIVICAHLDTQRTGWLWEPRKLKTVASILGQAPGPLKAPLFVLSLILLTQTVLGIIALQSTVNVEPSLLLIVFSVFYVSAIVVVGQWAVGSFVPGANDNATGVACALAVAMRWERSEHDDTELTVLITGCEESGLIGAAVWARAHQNELAEIPTAFLNLDTLGCRQLHLLENECALNGLVCEYPEALLELCRSVATEMSLEMAESHVIPTHTDGLAFLVRGIPGITLTSNEVGNFVPNYHLMSDRSENLDFASICRATDFAWRILLELEDFGTTKAEVIPGEVSC